MNNANALHVIFGTGQIGTRIAQRLVARGHRVRMVSRSAKAPAGIEAVAGDARDTAFAIEAARGAAVVYDTLNPLYPGLEARPRRARPRPARRGDRRTARSSSRSTACTCTARRPGR